VAVLESFGQGVGFFVTKLQNWADNKNHQLVCVLAKADIAYERLKRPGVFSSIEGAGLLRLPPELAG
jgi:hypothetical protein